MKRKDFIRQTAIGLDEERAPFLEGEKSHYICVRKNISKEHLMGFMMAPWELEMKDDERFLKVLKGIDLMAEALK